MTEEEKLLRAYELAKKAGKNDIAVKALKRLKEIRKPEKTLTDEFRVTGRPFELTGRSALTGLASMADVVTGPVKAGLNLIPGLNYGTDTYSDFVSGKMDELGVAKPETTGEKVVGKGVEFMSAGSPFIKAGGLLAQSSKPAVKGVGGILQSQPTLQATSAASGGAAGEYTKQQGGSPIAQFGASFAGGLMPLVGKSAITGVKSLLPNQKHVVESILGEFDLKGLPKASVERLKLKVADALTDGGLDRAALKRMVDFEIAGATPTKASVTLDPIDKTKQMNLAKIGANSSDPNLQTLSQVQNANNRALLGNLDDLAGGQTLDPYVGGRAAIKPVQAKQEGLLATQGELYRQARDSSGRALPLDRSQFTNRVSELLIADNKMAFLPKEIKQTINTISKGQIKVGGETKEVPFNVDTIDQLKTMLSSAQKGADGNVSRALILVRQALDETQIQGQASDSAMLAFDKARAATFALKQWEESSPAIKAIVDGASPDTFMDKFIIGKAASVDDVAKLVDEVKADPQAFQALKYQVAAWIKDKSSPTNIEGVGNLSSSALNSALKKVGKRKLELFFTPDEIKQIEATNRVAFYEMYQPVGSAINNSNTATTLTGGLLNFVADRSPTARGVGALLKHADTAINSPGRARQMLNPNLLKPRIGQRGALAVPLGLIASQGD